MKYYVQSGERTHEVTIQEQAGRLKVQVDGEPMDLSYEEAGRHGQVVMREGEQSYALSIEGGTDRVAVTIAGHRYDLAIEDEREKAAHQAERAHGSGSGLVTAVMPGVVVEIMAQPGEAVSEGQPLLILEAMKMQNEIPAPADGVVASLHVSAGDAVGAGDKLVTLEAG